MEVYSQSEKQYACKTITDLDFLEMGVSRCLSESKTGRDFLQRHGDNNRLVVDPRHFFKSLKSDRRIENLNSVNRLIKPALAASIPDPYSEISELNGFAVYSGDGHFHTGATHDRRQSTSKGGDRKPATGHFFMMNHRNHYLSHLATADVGGQRKGEHDMRVIKRSDIDMLRGNEPKGTKVIMVWDKAGIDLRYWYKVKNSSGLYFVSREKENMKLIACGVWPFDRADERNKGVINDEMVGPGSGGATLRRITYREPEKGIIYKFITTEMTLAPGIICLLYKHRWDIEKIFDQFKNKLDETKSWGSGKKSKTSHALFLCLIHNLMMLLEADLIAEGIENEHELLRKEKRLKRLIQNGGNFVATFAQRFKVRSLKFIRWLRNHIYREAPWDKAKHRLREIYDIF
jgi:hypothetical protein